MTLDEKNALLKTLNEDDFRLLGAPDVAYVREITFQGRRHFAVHSGDGTALIIAPNREMAIDAIQSQDMEAVTLH